MCGICFSVKQTFLWRRQRGCTLTGEEKSSTGINNTNGNSSNGRDAQRPAASPLADKGIIGVYTVVPCPVAMAAMLRVVDLPRCRRQYVPPSPQLLSSIQGSDLFMQVLDNIRRRGPETFGTTRRVLDEECVLSDHQVRKAAAQQGAPQQEQHLGESRELIMKTELQGISAVLGLRGHATVNQPFEMEVETDLEEEEERANRPVNKSFLLWNGEIFNGPMCPPAWGSDTVVLASRLSQLEQECVPTSEADPMNFLTLRDRQELFLARCVQVFEEEVQGPYGFLFYANLLQLAVFGRDPLGRHSLLAHIAIYHHPQAAVGETCGQAVGHAASATSTSSGPVMEVELIISSVGIQHAKRFSGEAASLARPAAATANHHHHQGSAPHNPPETDAAAASEGERKRPRPPTGNEPLQQSVHDDEATAAKVGDLSALGTTEMPPGGPDAPRADVNADSQRESASAQRQQQPKNKMKETPREQRKAKKKLKMESAAIAAAGKNGGDDGEGEKCASSNNNNNGSGILAAAAAWGIEEDEDLQGCWAELPVSGLFAVPLDRPLTNEDTLLSAAAGVAPLAGAAPACACGGNTTEKDVIHLDGAGVRNARARGVLMHCHWRDRYHLVHPLLRAFVAVAAQEQEGKKRKDRVDTTTTTTTEGGGHGRDEHPPSPGAAAAAPLPFGLPSAWAPPPRPLLFSADDTVLALPPLLAERIGHFAPPPGASDDVVWSHWAATCYLHALSAAVLRRTDVGAAGAEDSRDWATFAKAIRRPLCVLFSGGIDCTVLAALAHHVLPLETPIELVNVAFGPTPEQAPDRIAALRAVEELLKLPQPAPHEDSLAAAASQGTQAAREREWRLVLVDVPTKLSGDTSHILDLVTPRYTVMDLDIGTALWHAARGAGRMQVLKHSDVVRSDSEAAASACASSEVRGGGGGKLGASNLPHGYNKHVRIAQTTSAETDQYAVQQQQQQQQPTGSSNSNNKSNTNTNDEGKFELLIDILVEEGRQGDGPDKPVLLSTLGKEYASLLQPHIARYGYKKIGAFLNDACKAGLTLFDTTAASKAVLLRRAEDKARARPPPPCRWFATPLMMTQQQQQQQQQSGAAMAMTPPSGTCMDHYVSKAKVILVGMGADETLGGYTRYRRFFARHGMQGTRQELEKDFARLWIRNLGRDDRITMDSGREPRFPYLDEELLMTLEKIVAERRMALLSTNPPADSDSSFAQILQRRKSAPEAAAGTDGAPTDEEVEAALLQTSLEPIMSFRLGPGEGDKRVLRNVAAMIGLDTVTRLEKRAIQFGTRVADRRVSGATEL